MKIIRNILFDDVNLMFGSNGFISSQKAYSLYPETGKWTL